MGFGERMYLVSISLSPRAYQSVVEEQDKALLTARLYVVVTYVRR